MCGVEQAVEQDQGLARLHKDLGGDGVLIEAIDCKPGLDFTRGRWIDPPAQRVLQRIGLSLLFEVRVNPDHVDAPERRFNRLLATGFEQLVP